MKQNIQKLLAFACAITLFFTACKKEISQDNTTVNTDQGKNIVKDFTQVNLVANNDEYGVARIDPNLINAWGIAFSPTGNPWISSNGMGVSVVYNKDGDQVLPPVSIPSPTGPTGGTPTGQVFNSTSDFLMANGNPAKFIFVGEDGIISGWNGGSAASVLLNDGPNAVYKGVTIASSGGANYLYTANFSEFKIDVYDGTFQEVSMPFTDPNLPAGFSPFNIQNIDGMLFVAYAMKNPASNDEIAGDGLGYVDVYNTDGTLAQRFASEGQLNAPWGIAKAPASFFGNGGQNAILIGNFGDGHISSFTLSGTHMGQLRKHGQPIAIEGLWGLSFAPASAIASNPNWLYFTAGPSGEADGLFGYITK